MEIDECVGRVDAPRQPERPIDFVWKPSDEINDRAVLGERDDNARVNIAVKTDANDGREILVAKTAEEADFVLQVGFVLERELLAVNADAQGFDGH